MTAAMGHVTLVGAGPGDPDLITVRGRRCIETADVIVYDHLVNPVMLEWRRDDAELVNVGKMPSHHLATQEQINALLVRLAKQGKRVARLKSGDPFVFGRGGEERQFLLGQGVPCEVVPGVTSAIAGPAAAGIPITHRDYAAQFHVITGHRKQSAKELDWSVIARLEGTVVFLMGMAQLPHIVNELLAHGKSEGTPVAVIQWATRNEQRSTVADLRHIEEAVCLGGLGSPALIVVGGVARLIDPDSPGFMPFRTPDDAAGSRDSGNRRDFGDDGMEICAGQ